MGFNVNSVSVKVFYLFMAFLVLTVAYFPFEANSTYIINYIVDSISVFVVLMLFVHLSRNRRIDVFEPIVLITLVYSMMYFLAPMFDITFNEILWYGADVFPHGVKSTVIALLGYIAFYLGYNYSLQFRTIETALSAECIYDTDKNIHIIRISVLAMWLISFASFVYYLMDYFGTNSIYLFSMGLSGGTFKLSDDSASGFLSMTSYSLVTATLLYFEFGRRKFWKIIMFCLLCILQIVWGYRYLLVQTVIAFVAYYYIKNHKRPRISRILFVTALMLLPVTLMTVSRDTIRRGEGIINEIDSQVIKNGLNDAIMDNLRIYKNYYSVVGAVPETYDYVYGQQIFKGTLIMAVPRAIWPDKPDPRAGKGLKIIISDQVANGQAYPNLGEYYYAFGIPGVFGFMYLYGLWMNKVRKCYLLKANALDSITYVGLLATNLQLIIRGYTPSNVYMVIFWLLPVIVVKMIAKKKMAGV